MPKKKSKSNKGKEKAGGKKESHEQKGSLQEERSLLHSQLQQLQIDNNTDEDAFLEEAMKVAAAEKEAIEVAAETEEAHERFRLFIGNMLQEKQRRAALEEDAKKEEAFRRIWEEGQI
jgi:hypothetical protein